MSDKSEDTPHFWRTATKDDSNAFRPLAYLTIEREGENVSRAVFNPEAISPGFDHLEIKGTRVIAVYKNVSD